MDLPSDYLKEKKKGLTALTRVGLYNQGCKNFTFSKMDVTYKKFETSSAIDHHINNP